MKSTLYATREYLYRHGGRIVAFAMSVAIVTLLSLAFTTIASAQTFTPVTSSADVGSRGANVTAIQTFLASKPEFYPEGLITGYYGSLTAAAVRRFQVFYGIVSSGTPGTTGFGRVGPQTMAKMNQLIAGGSGGSGSQTGDPLRAPMIFNLNRSQTSNSVTFTFNTDESSTARVVYNSVPLMFNEGDINSIGFSAVGGLAVNSSSGMSTSHSVTISSLNANTTYYFTVIATDSSGNVSVWGPNNAIRTNQ